MTYRVSNSHGVSQGDCEVIVFHSFDDMRSYCMEHKEELDAGYIIIDITMDWYGY